MATSCTTDTLDAFVLVGSNPLILGLPTDCAQNVNPNSFVLSFLQGYDVGNLCESSVGSFRSAVSIFGVTWPLIGFLDTHLIYDVCPATCTAHHPSFVSPSCQGTATATGNVAQDTTLPANESLALERFYHATSGASWLSNDGWLTGNPCSWTGVECGTDPASGNDTVAELAMADNGLEGTLPAELEAFANLNVLNLKGLPMLSGTLPGGLAPNVRAIFLAWTAVSGTLPAEWASGRLRDVELHSNQLSGTIPASYGALTDLIDLDLYENGRISGTLPQSLSALTRLGDLSLDTNAISGTLPAAWGHLASQWEDIRLFGNALSGTLPASFADLTRLAFLRLGGNAISGSLPAVYGDLTSLRFVTLDNNALEGTLPDSFGNLRGLFSLDLRNNQLTLPSGTHELTLYDRATSRCASGGGSAQCRGLPPLSCTAFGANAVPSLTVPSSCVACTGNESLTVLFLALFLSAVVGALAFFVSLSVRHAHSNAMRRWVSTCVLLINHGQSLATLGSLSLSWPVSVRFVLDGFLSTNPLDLPGVSCLLSTASADESNLKNESTNQNNTVMLALPATLLLVLLAYREWLGLRGDVARAAQAELALSLVFSLQLVFSWRVVEGWAIGTAVYLEQIRRSRAVVGTKFSFMQELGEYVNRDPTALPPAVCAVGLLLLQLYLVGRFSRLVQSFHRGIKQGQWRLSGVCGCLWDGGHAVHPRHLSNQVYFLTRRFAPHAPRWQLVIWARQLTLVTVAGSAKAVQLLEPTASAAADDPARFGFAAAIIVVLLVGWRAHATTQPFAYRYQNSIESALYAATILVVVLACLCSTLQDEREPAFVVLEGLVLLLLVGSFILAVAYTVLQLRAIRQFLSNGDDLSGAVLANADAKIDAPLRERLADGTIRLLRCRWLVSAAADTFLRQGWTFCGSETMSTPKLCRRQELPPEAFCTPNEAVALLERGDRSVLAVSHRWQTYSHPDPVGSTLATILSLSRRARNPRVRPVCRCLFIAAGQQRWHAPHRRGVCHTQECTAGYGLHVRQYCRHCGADTARGPATALGLRRVRNTTRRPVASVWQQR